MAIEFEQYPAYYIARFSGTVIPEDLVAAARRADEIEDGLPAPVDCIVDLAAVKTFDVNFLAVSDTAKKRRERRYGRVVKSALIADRPVAVGFARMYQTILNNPEIEVRIFATMVEGLAWLEEGAPAKPAPRADGAGPGRRDGPG